MQQNDHVRSQASLISALTRTFLPEPKTKKARGKTVFVISHDDHYFHVADRVLKLDYGKIEADLTAEEFLETNRPVGVRVAG